MLPSPDHHYPTLTTFDPGDSRVFINTYDQFGWIKIQLVDDSEGSLNRDAIGARVIVNGEQIRVKRAGQGSHGAAILADLHFGLGEGSATSIRVEWPDKARTVSELSVDELTNGTLTITKNGGIAGWRPAAPVMEG